MSPTDYRVNNESLLIGGEVCLWTEYADDDSIMPRLWSVCCLFVICQTPNLNCLLMSSSWPYKVAMQCFCESVAVFSTFNSRSRVSCRGPRLVCVTGHLLLPSSGVKHAVSFVVFGGHLTYFRRLLKTPLFDSGCSSFVVRHLVYLLTWIYLFILSNNNNHHCQNLVRFLYTFWTWQDLCPSNLLGWALPNHPSLDVANSRPTCNPLTNSECRSSTSSRLFSSFL